MWDDKNNQIDPLQIICDPEQAKLLPDLMPDMYTLGDDGRVHLDLKTEEERLKLQRDHFINVVGIPEYKYEATEAACKDYDNLIMEMKREKALKSPVFFFNNFYKVSFRARREGDGLRRIFVEGDRGLTMVSIQGMNSTYFSYRDENQGSLKGVQLGRYERFGSFVIAGLSRKIHQLNDFHTFVTVDELTREQCINYLVENQKFEIGN